MKILNLIKYRRLQKAILDVCGKNECATCPSNFRYTNGATGCHGSQFLFGAAAKTYGIKDQRHADEKKEEED